MSDLLASLATNAAARKVLGSVGVPLPARLTRDPSAWRVGELADESVVVGFAPGATLAGAIAGTLAAAGANATLVDEANIAPEHAGAFTAAGEAWGRPPRPAPSGEVRALVFDASGMKDPADLRALHTFFPPRLRELGRSGRIVVLARPATHAESVAEAATRRALEGFVRALGREVGRNGITTHLVYVARRRRGSGGAGAAVPPLGAVRLRVRTAVARRETCEGGPPAVAPPARRPRDPGDRWRAGYRRGDRRGARAGGRQGDRARPAV